MGFTFWVSWWFYPSRAVMFMLLGVFVLSWALSAAVANGWVAVPPRLRARLDRPGTFVGTLLIVLFFSLPLLIPGRPNSIWNDPPAPPTRPAR